MGRPGVAGGAGGQPVRVVVTGGTSLLGQATARLLAERGDEVTLFQRRASGSGLNERLGSVTDADAVSGVMAGAEGVIHLAAKVGVVGAETEYAAVNVDGTRTVVVEARKAGASRIVHVSSPSVAHSGASLVGAPAAPASPDTARGPYARTKAAGERLALELSDGESSVVAIRPHLVWGPGDTQLIGRIVERARAGRLALVGSGLALIDTTYIDNAAAALVAGLDRAHEVGGRALVVSNGQPRTVLEVLSRITSAAGLDPPSLNIPAIAARTGGRVVETIWARTGRTDDPPMTSFLAEQLATAHWFDQRETREALGWEPAVPLEDGFDRLAAWFVTQRGSDAVD